MNIINARENLVIELSKLQTLTDEWLANRSDVRVLEVGCGSCSYIKLSSNAYIVGIDISEERLLRNKILNRRILGDIQTYNLPSSDFDVIIAWYVFEHLEHPEKALKNCQQALKENGSLIIAIPNVYSLKGLLTKFTPHWFHIWVYKYVYGYEHAGKVGYPPFHTYLKLSIAPASMERFALENGLSTEYSVTYEDSKQERIRQLNNFFKVAWILMELLTKVLSLNSIATKNSEYIVVLKRQKMHA